MVSLGWGGARSLLAKSRLSASLTGLVLTSRVLLVAVSINISVTLSLPSGTEPQAHNWPVASKTMESASYS